MRKVERGDQFRPAENMLAPDGQHEPALILSSVAPKVEEKILGSFRGGRAHDYRWLQERYFENGGPSFPKDITRKFLIVGDWSTSLRYLPRTMKITEARDFLKAANSIVLWVNSRI